MVIRTRRKISRRFLPSFGELCDRLAICQQKEIFIADHRNEYTKQVNDIVFDLDNICKEKKLGINGTFIRLTIIVTHMNTWIWQNEANRRKGIEDGNDLSLTHSLNTIRTQAYSMLSEMVGDRGEYKKDTMIPHPNWIPSLFEKKKPQINEASANKKQKIKR